MKNRELQTRRGVATAPPIFTDRLNTLESALLEAVAA